MDLVSWNTVYIENPWELKIFFFFICTLPLNFTFKTGFNYFHGNGNLVWCLFLVTCYPSRSQWFICNGKRSFPYTWAADRSLPALAPSCPKPLALGGILGMFLGCSLPSAAKSLPKPNSSLRFSVLIWHSCKQLPEEIDEGKLTYRAPSERSWRFIAGSYKCLIQDGQCECKEFV